MTPKFFALLLRDVAHLLRPSNILVLHPHSSPRRLQQHPEQLSEDFIKSHPSSTAVLGLSDISLLFQIPRQSRSGEKPSTTQNHVTLKLVFYAACILSTPPPTLRMISDELLIRAKKEEEDSQESLSEATGT
jgi:microsomal dipeptidase-like Zn-dependent dipeptidase